ncbi:MAG TPA: SpoIIE family protein phosphatase [Terriglobia bacterium]|nr:SpoIIE family protein phosphatase [Terriglobia bacterium]
MCLIIAAMGSAPTAFAAHATIPLDRHSPYLRMQSVTIYVRDVDRSLRFYVDRLGFDLVFDGRMQRADRFVTVAPPDGTANLTLVAPARGSEANKLIGRATRITFVTEDVLVQFREWRKRGVEFLHTPRLRRLKSAVQVTAPRSSEASTSREQTPPIWGGVFTRFKDVDGNSFSLVSFDEVSRELEAERRAAAEKLESERRVAQELEIAKQVQARLFPQTLPPLRRLEYAGTCIQARAVGGDYYDFLDLGRDRLGFVVGDISGKGIAAALLMANLQANLRSQFALAVNEPQRFLHSVNDLFYQNSDESSYATLFFAEYDDELQRLRYANCGHLSALLLHDDNGLERLESTCTVLGLFKDWDCSITERRLLPGDTLAIYTDGVSESFSEAGEEFGEERLIAALRRDRELAPHDLLASIVKDVQRFSSREQHDDITLIVAKARGD